MQPDIVGYISLTKSLTLSLNCMKNQGFQPPAFIHWITNCSYPSYKHWLADSGFSYLICSEMSAMTEHQPFDSEHEHPKYETNLDFLGDPNPNILHGYKLVNQSV